MAIVEQTTQQREVLQTFVTTFSFQAARKQSINMTAPYVAAVGIVSQVSSTLGVVEFFTSNFNPTGRNGSTATAIQVKYGLWDSDTLVSAGMSVEIRRD